MVGAGFMVTSFSASSTTDDALPAAAAAAELWLNKEAAGAVWRRESRPSSSSLTLELVL